MRPWALLGLGLVGVGCRTQLKPYSKPPATVVYVGDKTCSVYDFASATEVPEGAANLGWVSVPSAGSDEETYVKLREKICSLGGDALSQPAWVREGEEVELKANAWVLP